MYYVSKEIPISDFLISSSKKLNMNC